MLSSVLVAALAAGALAVPYKRDVVTDVDWVVVTDIVTVYATAPTGANRGWGGVDWQNTWTQAPSSTWVPPAPPAPTSTSTSTWVPPPPPAPTTTSTSEYVAPSPTSTWVAPTTEAPAPAPTTEAPAPSSSSTSAWSAPAAPTDYASTAVWHHNAHRANQTGTGDVSWDDDLAAAAQQIANTCTFAHSMNVNGLSYGQNIAAGAQDVGTVISNLWYNGEAAAFAPYYNEANPGGDFDTYGHFTQVVWKGTNTVGCATASCAGQGSWANGNWGDVPSYFTVCNYGPAGNVDGEYADNIGTPLNLPTVSGSS